MKFTNGFWLTKPEYEADYVREIYDFKTEANTLTLYAPFRKINSRGETLNLGFSTINIDSPLQNVLRVRITNFAGQKDNFPKFNIEPLKEYKGDIHTTEQTAKITSGNLSLCVQKGRAELNFYADDKFLTKTSARGISRMKKKTAPASLVGDTYTVTELMLDVGEVVYGLGERFTPFVKNGQVIDCWNEDGGTASEIAYKNIPFYFTNKNYGVFVNHCGKVSFEVGSEKVESVQFSVKDQELEYFLIYGKTQKEVLANYTLLTGRAPILPKWSYGLWLTTSFTTNYDEQTVSSFVDGMKQRDIPLRVFHFDCFWMKEFEWCNFEWDKKMFPDPKQMLCRLHAKGLKICVWINSYIAQKSPLFAEGMQKDFLLKNKDGSVFQWDLWQGGMAIVDFTNPNAYSWFQQKLKALLDMGVDCFKTDFGERIPCLEYGYDVAWHDGSNQEKMHNYYTYLYNKCVYELLQKEKGQDQAVLFARSATTGGQKFPVHWGGDSTSQFVSMAESLRAGLSLMDSGFAFWSHDIGGFEDTSTADLYKRWVAFGLLSSHSRLHGSTSYRVPWLYDEQACDVLRFFTKLKCSLMPYIYTASIQSHFEGVPLMRPMHIEYEKDLNCLYLDKQYMLGDSILVAPVFAKSNADSKTVTTDCSVEQSCYLPEGTWIHLLSNKVVQGGKWFSDSYNYFSLPVFAKGGTIIPFGTETFVPDYDYEKSTVWHVYGIPQDNAKGVVLDKNKTAIASIYLQVLKDKEATTLYFELNGNEYGGKDKDGYYNIVIHSVSLFAKKDFSFNHCTAELKEDNLYISSKEQKFSVIVI